MSITITWHGHSCFSVVEAQPPNSPAAATPSAPAAVPFKKSRRLMPLILFEFDILSLLFVFSFFIIKGLFVN